MGFEDEDPEYSVPQVVPAVGLEMSVEDGNPRCVVPQVVPAAEVLNSAASYIVHISYQFASTIH